MRERLCRHLWISFRASTARFVLLASGLVLAVAVFGTSIAMAQAGTIGFESAVSDADHQQAWSGDCCPPYIENGFSVQSAMPPAQLLANNPAQDTIGNGPDGGSKYMAALGDGLAPLPPVGEPYSGISVSRADGVHFQVVDIRLSEYSSVFDRPLEVLFVGIQPTGTVEQTFTTDGIIDGTGPLDDFEAVVLGAEFTDLIGFEVYGLVSSTFSAPLALDDIGYVLAPEPSTALLVGVGLFACACRRGGRARLRATT